MQVQIVEVQDPSNWNDAFAAKVGEWAEAVYVIESPSHIFHAKYIASVALKKQISTMFDAREHVETGGLMAYASSIPRSSGRNRPCSSTIRGSASSDDGPCSASGATQAGTSSPWKGSTIRGAGITGSRSFAPPADPPYCRLVSHTRSTPSDGATSTRVRMTLSHAS